MRYLKLGLWRSFNGHNRLVSEAGNAAQILVCDISVGLVLIEQLQLQFCITYVIVQLILFGFQVGNVRMKVGVLR